MDIAIEAGSWELTLDFIVWRLIFENRDELKYQKNI